VSRSPADRYAALSKALATVGWSIAGLMLLFTASMAFGSAAAALYAIMAAIALLSVAVVWLADQKYKAFVAMRVAAGRSPQDAEAEWNTDGPARPD
jgi:hypothetical protein